MKKSLIFIMLFVAFAAKAVTEQEYLLANKTYTDGLLAFYVGEDKNNKQLALFKSEKKTAESELKKTTSALSKTSAALVSEQNLLVELKDKDANKVQLEIDLNAQKKKNTASINKLEGQINTKDNSLDDISFQVSQIENEKSLLEQKVSTQQQLANLAKDNINRLENDIWFLENDISSNKNRIQNLRAEIQSLELQLQASVDPVEQQSLQAQINNKQQRIQQLKSDIDFNQGSIQSKKLQILNENSQLQQAQSNLNSLKIQLNGKQNELNSQLQLKNQLESEISNLKSQQASLAKKNKNINAELELLQNLPTHIANAQANIVSLSNTKLQQETAVNTLQTQVTTVTTSLTQLQLQVDTDKKAVLASEKNHDALLKEFLKTNTAAVPIELPLVGEMPISIDSVVVSEVLNQSKDWTVFKGTSTTLNASVCAASTRLLDEATGVLSELLVVKIINSDATYSSPFVLTTHSMIPQLVLKGQLRTDKSKSILLPILQSSVANEKALLSRYSDSENIISVLKAHNSAKVEFTIPGSPVTVPFSLKGSSAMIKALETTCKN